MTMRKNVFGIFLICCLLCGLLSAGVSAAEPAKAGDSLDWTVSYDGTLTISGSGAMYDWSRTEDEPWFPYLTGIRRVEIGSGVTHIGAFAFFSCIALEEAGIPGSVTSVGSYAFGYCDRLSRVAYPKTPEQWSAITREAGNGALDAAAVDCLSAQPSSQQLSVNGELRAAEIYNIGGNNYFKLRDVAMLLNGTLAQFSVGYDAASGTITVQTGAPYEPAGGELATGTDRSDTCKASTQLLTIDGSAPAVTAYNIGGNNFFKLRELGDALGFQVDYDAATNTVLVSAGNAAAPTPPPPEDEKENLPDTPDPVPTPPDPQGPGEDDNRHDPTPPDPQGPGEDDNRHDPTPPASDRSAARSLYENALDRYDRQEYATAVTLLAEAAEAGSADAMYLLGYSYEYGQGVEKNNEQAARFYARGAEAGNDKAMCALGYCYENGKGLAVNFEKAAEWYKESAEAGNTDAMRKLADCYESGLGVSPDDNMAEYWRAMAAG